MRMRLGTAKKGLTNERKAAIPLLVEALEDRVYVVRQYAEEALTRLGVGQMVYFRG